MKPLFKLLLTMVLAFNLSACAATTAYWKTPLPENPNQYSAVERTALYNSFAIEEMSALESYVNSVTLDGKKYGLETYYPIMLQVSPNLETEFNAIRHSQQTRVFTTSLLAAGSMAPVFWIALSPDMDILTRLIYYSASMMGLLVALGIDTSFLFWQQDKYNQIKNVFNEDLKNYLSVSSFSYYPVDLAHPSKHSFDIPTQLTMRWQF